MWFIFALLSALLASIRRTGEKRLTHQLSPFTIGWSVQLLSLPLLFGAMLLEGSLLNPIHLSARFWVPTILLWFGFYPINQFLYVNALKHGELSKIAPLQGLGPVFGLLMGSLFLEQVPSIQGLFGILTVVVGIYILNMKGRSMHNPLKMFSKDMPNLYTLLGMFMLAIAGVLDTIAIKASAPVYYCFVSTVGAVVVLYSLSMISGTREVAKVRHYIKPLSSAGSLFALTYCCYLLALARGPLAYVSAVRCLGMVFSVLIGVLYFREHFTRLKIFALALILCGAVTLSIA